MISLQEALSKALEIWQIRVKLFLYTKNGASTFFCSHESCDDVYIVKVISVTTGEAQVTHEVELLEANQHPFAAPVRGHFWFSNHIVKYLCIIFEGREKDLSTELKLRKQAGSHWSEDQLWYYCRCLISVLASKQEQGIAHRDISPQSVYLAADGTAKVGNWVNSLEIGETVYTFVQTASFFSPELKLELLHQQRPGQYDPHKSDVYSLGLVFLAMAWLECPASLQTLNSLEWHVEQCICQLWYSETFKDLLRGMLRVDPSQRYSFLDLRDWLEYDSYHQYMERLHRRSILPNIVADENHEITIVPRQQGSQEVRFAPNVVVPEINSRPQGGTTGISLVVRNGHAVLQL